MSARLMGEVWELDLPRSERDVLLALADHAHDDGTSAKPGVPYLVWKTDLARSTVISSLRGLEEKEVIVAVHGATGGRGVVTEYRLHLEKSPRKRPFQKGSDLPKTVRSGPAKPSDLDDETVRSSLARQEEPPIEPSLEPLSLVSAAWRENAPPLIEHREGYFSAEKTATAVRAALRVYPVEAVEQAIRNYAAVLGGKEYRWSYSWTLIDFLKRGLDKFVPEADPLRNFRSNGRAGSVTGADFSHLPDL